MDLVDRTLRVRYARVLSELHRFASDSFGRWNRFIPLPWLMSSGFGSPAMPQSRYPTAGSQEPLRPPHLLSYPAESRSGQAAHQDWEPCMTQTCSLSPVAMNTVTRAQCEVGRLEKAVIPVPDVRASEHVVHAARYVHCVGKHSRSSESSQYLQGSEGTSPPTSLE